MKWTKKWKSWLLSVCSALCVCAVALGAVCVTDWRAVADNPSEIVFVTDNNAKNAAMAIPKDGNNWYNTVVTTEDGFMKITPRFTSNGYATGLLLDGDDVAPFAVENYPYFKIRMKRTVGTWDTALFDKGATWQGKPVFSLSMTMESGAKVYWEASQLSVVNGVWADVIFDLNKTDANAPVKYVVDGSTSEQSVKFDYSAGSYSGNFKSMEITPFGYNQEEMPIERELLVEYFGLFPSYDAAKNYETDKNARVTAAKNALATAQFSMPYIDGKTEETAIENAMKAISTVAGVGVTGLNPTYQVSNDKSTGFVRFESVELASGGEKTTVSNLTVVIEKPYDPVVWTYTQESDLAGMTNWDLKTMEIKDNSLHIVKKTAKEEDGFDFEVDMAENDPTSNNRASFQMENYGYLKMMFKVVGQGRLQFYHFETDENGKSGKSNSRSFVVGWAEDTWLSVIIDFSKTYGAVTVENMETGEIETYDVYGDNYAKNFTPVPFEGLSERFRFNFGRRHNLEREAYIKYIAFFPTMEQALAYDSGKQAFEIDAEMNMQQATFSANYEDANTLERAIKVAKEQVLGALGFDADVRLQVNTYNEPTAERAGELQFDAEVSYRGSSFTFNGLSMPIAAQRDIPAVSWFFNNAGVLDVVDAKIGGQLSMQDNVLAFNSKITSGFVVRVEENRFFAENYKNLCLGVKSLTAGTVVVTVHTDEGDFAVPLTVDGSSFVKKYFGSMQGIKGRIESVEFDCNSIELHYLAFITGDTFDGRNPYSTALTGRLIDLERNYTAKYYNAKTESMAKAALLAEVSKRLDDDMVVSSVTVDRFQKPTANENGVLYATLTFTNDSVLCKGFAEFSFTLTTDKAVNNDIVYDFSDAATAEKVDGLWNSDDDGNFTYDAEKGEIVMKADNVDDTNGVGFCFTPIDDENKTKEMDIQEYKYIKFGFTRNGYGVNTSNTSTKNYTGKAQIIFRRKGVDAAYQHFEKDMMYCTFEWNLYGYLGQPLCALLDLGNKTVSVFDSQTNELLYTDVLEIDKSANYDAFNGIANQMYVTMCRNVKQQTSAAYETPSATVSYFGMFNDETTARAYQGEFYAKATALDGNNYLKSSKTLTGVTTVDALVKISRQETVTDGLVLAYGKVETYVTATGALSVRYDGTEIFADTSEDYRNDRYVHLMWNEKNGKIELYVNGVKKGEGNGALGNGFVQVGGKSARENNLRGFCVFVKAWKNVALDEIFAYAYETEVSLFGGLVGAWRLTGEDFEQRSLVEGAGAMNVINVYGRQGHEFIGEDYLSTEKALDFTLKTVEIWLRIHEKDAGKAMTVFSNVGTNKISLEVLTDGNLRFTYGAASVTTENYNVAGKGWVFVSIVMKADATEWYFDGELFQTFGVLSATGVSNEPIIFGYDATSQANYMTGVIGETRFWSVERTAQEILDGRDGYATGNETGLERCYRFDASKNLVYADYSADKADATIHSDGFFKTNMTGYEHTIVILGDSQNHIVEDPTKNDVNTQWILDNKEKENISFVMHVGDFTQNSTDLEMMYAYNSISALNGILPYVVTMGNHDFPSLTNIGAEIRDSSTFNKYMDYDYFSKLPNFGGTFEKGKMENVYMYFETGDIEWMIMVLEFAPRDEVVEWADYIIAQNPDKNVIILTHQFMSMTRINEKGEQVGVSTGSAYLGKADFTMSGEGMYLDVAKTGVASQAEETVNEGLDVWNKLGKRHKNIVQIVSGHSQADTQFRAEEGENGNTVNFVHHDASTTRKVGDWSHDTFIALMKFNDDGSACVYQYDTTREAYYKTDYFYEYELNLQSKGE